MDAHISLNLPHIVILTVLGGSGKLSSWVNIGPNLRFYFLYIGVVMSPPDPTALAVSW